MNIKLFHISYDHCDKIESFVPYVPLQRAIGEDSSRSRICTSDSIEGCFAGSPHTDMLFVEGGLVYDEVYDIYYTKDNEYNGVPAILYEFDVPRDKVNFPEEVKQYVPDALETNEHWITEEVKPTGIRYLLLEDAVYPMNEKPKFFYVELSKENFDNLIMYRND